MKVVNMKASKKRISEIHPMPELPNVPNLLDDLGAFNVNGVQRAISNIQKIADRMDADDSLTHAIWLMAKDIEENLMELKPLVEEAQEYTNRRFDVMQQRYRSKKLRHEIRKAVRKAKSDELKQAQVAV